MVSVLVCGSTGLVRAHPEIQTQIDRITALLGNSPADEVAELLLRRADLHRVHQDWDAARADLDRAREADRELARVDLVLGRVELDASRPLEARRALRRFVSRRPDHAEGRVSKARAEALLGNHRTAARDFGRAIDAAGPDQRPAPTVYLERARALMAAGTKNRAEALGGLASGLERLGGPITLELYALELEIEGGLRDAALARVDRLMSAARRKESWLMRRGAILEQGGSVELARAAYAGALEAIEALPPSRRNTRNVRELIDDAEAALARLPDEEAAP